MTVTVDSNLLIYAIDDSSPFYRAANETLATMFTTGEAVWLFPPTLVAFLRVATHPRLFPVPLSLSEAFVNLRKFTGLPTVQLGVPDDQFINLLESVATAAGARGKLIHDAEIVALMRQHGVGRILTADRDFLRFEGIEVTLLSA